MKRLLSFAVLLFASTDLVACVSDDNNPPLGTPIEDSGGTSVSDGGLDATLGADGGDASASTSDAGDANVSSDAGPPEAGPRVCTDAGTGLCLVVLASGQGNPQGLVLHGGYLYWIEEGLPQHIHRILLAGGAAEDLGAAGVASSTLAVDNTTMYWNDQYHGAIYAAPNTGIPSGGAPTVLGAVDGGGVWSMIIDSSRVYWTDYNAGKVYAVSISGGSAPTVLASPGGTPNGLATDGTNLYWSNTTASAIQAVSLTDGGAPVTIAPGVSAPSQVTVSQGTIYFASASANDIYSFPSSGMTDGGTPPIFVATGPQTTSSFVYDGIKVYWTTNADPGGEVQSAPPSGTATPLALGMTAPGSLTDDTSNIYWANFAYGSVFLMAKP